MREFLRRVLPEPVANFLRLCICSINDIAMRLKLWLRGHQRSSGTALLKPAQLDRLLIQELAACAEGVVGVVDERLMWFVDRLEALARPVGRGKRILVWPFERTGATGHLAMEPFYVKSVYGDDYDQIIVVTRQRHSAHNSNTEIFDCVFAGMTVVCTDDPVLLALSGHELGVVERGPFAFLLHSYAYISRAFFRHCIAGGKKSFLALSPAQEERGRQLLETLGIPSGAKWVVAHARESGFHNRAYDNYRCTSIDSYYDAIRFLAEEGYFVLRVGDRSMTQLPDLGPRVFDLPFRAEYDFLLDVYGIAHCEFMMSAHSGPCMLARAFDRPCLGINVPVTFAHIPGERDMLALRRYHAPLSEGGHQLSYAEILDAYYRHGQDSLEFHGYGYSMLSSQEVLPIVREMVERADGSKTEPLKHNQFMTLNREVSARAEKDVELQKRRHDWFGCAKPGTAIPDAYNETYPNFL